MACIGSAVLLVYLDGSEIEAWMSTGSSPQAQCLLSCPSQAAWDRDWLWAPPPPILEVRLFLNRPPHYWDSETGENDSFTGKGHTNQVSRMTVDESGQLVSCSMDDTVRYTNLTLRDYR